MLPSFKNLIKRSDLIFELSLKEIKRRYKQRYLRLAWAVINPLISVAVFTLVFSKAARITSENVPYPIFSFTALVPWYFFAACVTNATNSLITNAHFISKIRIPRIVLPISQVCSNLLDFAISLALLFFLCLFYKISFTCHILWLIPIFVIQFIFTLGMAFILSIANAYMRDIQNVVPVLLKAWLLLSPVAYPLHLVAERHRFLYLLNPMAGILDGYRKALIHHRSPELTYLGISFIVSIIIFWAGYLMFKKMETHLADII
jgi:lipopolysaccharide transport system permease protein